MMIQVMHSLTGGVYWDLRVALRTRSLQDLARSALTGGCSPHFPLDIEGTCRAEYALTGSLQGLYSLSTGALQGSGFSPKP